MEKSTFQNISEAKEVFEHLWEYAKSYKQAEIQQELGIIQPKLELEHKVAIIGNKNAGKSTFIEAAFGDKIPPESPLSDADIALFVLDYEQLDASLNDDEQGPWHAIQDRVAKDKDFEVFFILNKIDMALNGTESKEDWSYNKQQAIGNLKNVGIKHGIQNPQIYPVSSRYFLLHHNRKTENFDEEEEREIFEKKFKQKFDDK